MKKKFKNKTKKIECKKDKYGVSFDSAEYIDLASVASNTDHTGIVPFAMNDSENEESYEAMFNVPVGNIADKKETNGKKIVEKNKK